MEKKRNNFISALAAMAADATQKPHRSRHTHTQRSGKVKQDVKVKCLLAVALRRNTKKKTCTEVTVILLFLRYEFRLPVYRFSLCICHVRIVRFLFLCLAGKYLTCCAYCGILCHCPVSIFPPNMQHTRTCNVHILHTSQQQTSSK